MRFAPAIEFRTCARHTGNTRQGRTAMKTTTSQTAARFLLDGLSEAGIEYLFCNFGTDHAPIIEEMARMEAAGLAFPKPILCPHENTAMHMAGGYALATGRGQGVMVHGDVGTANAAMGMHNLFRTRIPVILMAGKAPYTSLGELPGTRDDYVHFVQEPMDQGSIVRPFAKWEYTLPSGAVAKETVRRAHTLMQSDPPGPVHLMFARETLAEHWQPEAIRSFPDRTHAPQKAGGIDPVRMKALAEKLMRAERPMLITGYGGRSRRTSDAIEKLSRVAGMRVFENAPVINIGRKFPGFGGFRVADYLPMADFGLMVDTDVPWIPRDTAPHPDAYWAHIDIDTIKKAIPMWSFPAQERIEADAGQAIEQLVEAIEKLGTAASKAAATARWAAMQAQFAARKKKAADAAADPGQKDAINV